MATDKLINQTQGGQLISGLTAIASEIASINTNAVRPNSTSTTENDIMVYGSNAYTAKDSGVSIETAQISGTLDTKLPTSKNIKTNVAGTAVLTNYPSTTPTSIQSVEATDTITQAIKKVEGNTQINNNNILLSYGGIVNKNVAKENNFQFTAYQPNAYKKVECDPLSGDIELYIGELTSTDVDASTCAVILYYTDGTSSSTNQLSRGQNITKNISIGNKVLSYITIYPSDNYSHSNGDKLTVTNLMICSYDDYTADPTYQPYTLSNVDLTAKNAVNENNISYLANQGSKNKLLITRASGTVGDFSVVKNSNGFLEFTGTAGSDTNITLRNGYQDNVLKGLNYYDNLEGDSRFVRKIVYSNGSSQLAEHTLTNGYTISSQYTKYNIYITIKASTQLTNFEYTPMVCTEGLYNADNTIVPYALSNTELTNNISSVKMKTKRAAYTVTTANTYEIVSYLAVDVPSGKVLDISAYGYSNTSNIMKIKLLIGDDLSVTGAILVENDISPNLRSCVSTHAVYYNAASATRTVNVAVYYNNTGSNSVGIVYNIYNDSQS